jgi:hypothetical protein
MSLFPTITGADWRRSIAEARARPNRVSEQIRQANIHMKFLTMLMLLLAAKTASASDETLLRAIAQVESGDNTNAVGGAMERGKYQMTEMTWRFHTSLPFTDAHDEAKAHAVALLHLRWLRRELAANLGREPGIRDLASAWKCGPAYCMPKYISRESRKHLLARLDYSRRVQNLYDDFNK